MDAFSQNLITVAQIDTALTRVLDPASSWAFFDPPEMNPFLRITMAENNTPEHRQVALKLAREALVLLKNDGTLPLIVPRFKRIAVFGENATAQNMLYGNYNGTPSSAVTILRGIRALAGPGIEVLNAQGCPLVLGGGGGGGRGGRGGGQPAAPARTPEELRAEALNIASNADVLIYVGGIDLSLEGEEGNARGGGGVDGFSNGDRTKIELPQVPGGVRPGPLRNQKARHHDQLQRLPHGRHLGGRTSARHHPGLVPR